MNKTITTYEELRQWIKSFHTGALDILIIEGSAGAGKSSMVKNSLKSIPDCEYGWLEGRLSAVLMYEMAYHCRDLPIFLDDIDSLHTDRNFVNLLKCLCQTDDEKRLSWHTKAVLADDVPHTFTTRSKVCIITNSWRSINKHVGAVEDRGILLSFYPDPYEVHARAMKLDLADEEIYRFLESYLDRIQVPSLRHYKIAHSLKMAGQDWKDALVESFGLSDDQELVIKLMEDDTLKPSEKAKRYAELTGKSSRTFWRVKKEMDL